MSSRGGIRRQNVRGRIVGFGCGNGQCVRASTPGNRERLRQQGALLKQDTSPSDEAELHRFAEPDRGLYQDHRRLRGSEGLRGATRSKYPTGLRLRFPSNANVAP